MSESGARRRPSVGSDDPSRANRRAAGSNRSPDSVNRRRFARFPVDLRTRISTIDPENEPRNGRPYFRTSQEVSSNVSRGGVFIRTSDPISPGRRILVELTFPSGSVLDAVGRVAWSKTIVVPDENRVVHGIGVEFLGRSPHQLHSLEEYLNGREEAAI